MISCRGPELATKTRPEASTASTPHRALRGRVESDAAWHLPWQGPYRCCSNFGASCEDLPEEEAEHVAAPLPHGTCILEMLLVVRPTSAAFSIATANWKGIYAVYRDDPLEEQAAEDAVRPGAPRRCLRDPGCLLGGDNRVRIGLRRAYWRRLGCFLAAKLRLPLLRFQVARRLGGIVCQLLLLPILDDRFNRLGFTALAFLTQIVFVVVQHHRHTSP
mmetsp:Transcript_137127/g.292903  ORF Transcript_137127/g.292903 Transcript_137127/m.292903 type:complete len:218 (+) Transcript_137127:3-656(+)